MHEYDEKRGYPRIHIECPARFEVVGQRTGGAIVKNLSGGGVLIWIEQELVADTALKIEIKPVNDITAPLYAELRVVRCTPVAEAAGSFAVACKIRRILG